MAGKTSQRDKIVRATADLLRRRGYAATGLSDIIEASGAPKGSLYYYFPGGKDEIAAAALRHAGDVVERTLSELETSQGSAPAILRAYGEMVAGWMAQSGFRDGCPITTTILETATDKAGIAEAGREVFARWRQPLARSLTAAGVEPRRAGELAQLAFMALEGALIMARAEMTEAPIRLAVEEAARLFERETAG